MTRISLSEAKKLVASWSKGTFPTVSESIKYHFMRHGRETVASDVWQYLRKADAFRRSLRGAEITNLEGRTVRYTKKGYYLIKEGGGKILSFGTER